MTEHMRPAAQLDVQRALGRCMLSLQQYEQLREWIHSLDASSAQAADFLRFQVMKRIREPC